MAMPLDKNSAQFVASDRDKRVSVSLPRQLKELRGQASRAYKQPKFKMWLHGNTLLREPQQISALKDGDLVVVQPEEDSEAPGDFLSTHKAEFVKHPLPAKYVRPSGPPPMAPGKFEGQTENMSAYVRHPQGVSQPIRPKTGGWRNEGEFEGVSTYKAHYPGYTARRDVRKSPNAWQPNNVPFEGQTSYTHDYVKHPNDYSRQKRAHQRHWIDAPFDGMSTYNAEYKPHEARLTTPWKPPQTSGLSDMPFQGITEYTNEYLKHPMADALIHLEPAVNAEKKQRPSSAHNSRGKVVRRGPDSARAPSAA
jgi:hypothetical protein